MLCENALIRGYNEKKLFPLPLGNYVENNYQIEVDTQGNIFMTRGHQQVIKFDSQGNFITDWLVSDENPVKIALDSKDNIYVEILTHYITKERHPYVSYLDVETGRSVYSTVIVVSPICDFSISKYNSLGKVLYEKCYMKKKVGSTLNPIALDSYDNLFICFERSVLMYNNRGVFMGSFGSRGSGPGQFDEPIDIAVDKENNVYILDKGNFCIQKFLPSNKG